MSVGRSAQFGLLAPDAEIDLIVGPWNEPLAQLIPGVTASTLLATPWLCSRRACTTHRGTRLSGRCHGATATTIWRSISRATSERTCCPGWLARAGVLDSGWRRRPPADRRGGTRWRPARGRKQPRAGRARLRPAGGHATGRQSPEGLRQSAPGHPRVGPIRGAGGVDAGGWRPSAGVAAGRSCRRRPRDQTMAAGALRRTSRVRACGGHGAAVVLDRNAGRWRARRRGRAGDSGARRHDVIVSKAASISSSLAGVLSLSRLLRDRRYGPDAPGCGRRHAGLAVFGPSMPWRYAPLVEPHRIVRVDLPCSPCNRIRLPPERCRGHVPDCLDHVTTDAVIAAGRELLGILRVAAGFSPANTRH